MSSPIDYIFMKYLDKCVVIIISISSSSKISIEFMVINTILDLDDLCYHRPLYWLPSNTNLFVFCVIPWVPCYPAFVLLYLGVLPSLMSRKSWEFHHLLWILDTGNTSHHHLSFLVPVLVLTGIPTSERYCVDFVLLKTLLLWSWWLIVCS